MTAKVPSRRDRAVQALGLNHAGTPRPFPDGGYDARGDPRSEAGSRRPPTDHQGGPGRGPQLSCVLAEAGVDHDDVTETLEKEGVEKFEKS